ncbi:hypothetical protein ACVCL3_02715 [Rhodanobacter sp. UC4437_H4]
MTESSVENVVAVVRHKGRIRWFRSGRDLWILDYRKWRDSFINRGYSAPELDDSDRGGVHVVNRESAERFLDFMSEYEVGKDQLSVELARRYSQAQSWWDVADLFPIIFVDFDNERVAAFYPRGTPMEKYLPDGWDGEFRDFATEYPAEIFPEDEKFWVKGGADLLQLLNERGKGRAES